ncbi:hypothetical protein SAG0083_05090 [Streptococcus agalactiae LMG 15084]|nr:hypothetical protein SAG0083_05090 [Streptococcus agalactiae LMG 15084]
MKFKGGTKSGQHVVQRWEDIPVKHNKSRCTSTEITSRRCAFCCSKGDETQGNARLRYTKTMLFVENIGIKQKSLPVANESVLR